MSILRALAGFGRRRELSAQHYPGVLVPLHEAHLYGQATSLSRNSIDSTSSSSSSDDGKGGSSRHKDDTTIVDEEEALEREREEAEILGERRGMLEMNTAEYTIEGLKRKMRRGSERGRRWTEYEIKSKLVNKAIQDIGMGRYNWHLFVLCGFGWFADNLWMQGVSLILPSLSATFDVSEKRVRLTTSSLYFGLCFGSFIWGVTSDMLGRRLAFNATLFITALFGLSASFAPSWPVACAAFSLLGFGVGGNLPVDGALFLEFLPDEKSSLLTLLSVWWPIGQLVSSLIAWYCIARWPVELGWRYFIFAIGIITFIMFIIRCFIFDLFESPKYLLSRGRQDEAVAVVHGIAYRNGAKTWLTSEILDAVAEGADLDNGDEDANRSLPHRGVRNQHAPPSAMQIIKEKLAAFSVQRISPLFRHRTLGMATALVWFSWATIGMGYPLFNAFLPQYLSHGGLESSSASIGVRDSSSDLPTPISPATYRAYAIASLSGVPGSFLAAFLVDHPSPFLGRRGTLATSTLVSAVFLFLFVVLGTSPAAQLIVSCVEAFSQNIMYGVLYAFTPEMFPAPVRGAGTGVASFLNRVAGLAAPVVAATVPGDGASTPVFLSSALILSAFIGICMIPIETRGAQRL